MRTKLYPFSTYMKVCNEQINNITVQNCCEIFGIKYKYGYLTIYYLIKVNVYIQLTLLGI